MSKLPNDTIKVMDRVEWSLSALTKELGNIKVDVEESLTIGRGTDNGLVLASKKISRQHACLTKKDNKIWLKDLGSSNGTKVNGELLISNADTELQNGSVVDISGFEFEVIKQITANDVMEDSSKNEDEENKAILKLDTENPEDKNIEEPNINDKQNETSPVEAANIEEVTIESTKNITTTVNKGVSGNEVLETQLPSNIEVANNLVESKTTEVQPKYASAPLPEKKQNNVWIVYVLIAIIIGFAALMTI